MEYLKRKLRARQPKMQIKKNETFKAKTTEPEQKKVPLKTIFKKVRTGEDGSSIYMIKSTNDTPVNAPLQSDITEKNAPNFASKAASTVCSQIPDFTTEDIAALIDCSDLNAFINFSLDNNEVDEAIALLNLHTSTPAGNNFTTTDHNITNRNSTLHFPPDRSTEENKSENSSRTCNSTLTTQILKDEPILAFTDPVSTVRSSGQYDEASTCKQQENRESDDNDVSMTDNQIQICESNGNEVNKYTVTDNRCEIQVDCPASTNDKEIWMADIGCTQSWSTPQFGTSYDRHTESFGEVKPKNICAVSPVKVLGEMLRPRKLAPVYRFRQISNSMFQCHVSVKKQNACGTGKSRDYARNSAALSILDKLIDTKYFGNVIGRLQELCARIKWPPPKYSCEMTARMKIINENVFVVVCSVKQYKEIGQGRSKKMAKLFAAYKMWHKLTGKA